MVKRAIGVMVGTAGGAPPTGDPRAAVGGQGDRRRWAGLGGRSDGRSEARPPSPRGAPRRQGGRCHPAAGGHAARPCSATPACSTRSWRGPRCRRPPAGAATCSCAPCRGSGGWWRPPIRSRRTASRCPRPWTGSGRLSTWWKPRLGPGAGRAHRRARRLGPAAPTSTRRPWTGAPRRPARRVTVRFLDARGPDGQPLEQAAQGQPGALAAPRAARRPRGARLVPPPARLPLRPACLGPRRRRRHRRPPRRLLGSPPMSARPHFSIARIPVRVEPAFLLVSVLFGFRYLRDRARRGAHLGGLQLRLDPRARAGPRVRAQGLRAAVGDRAARLRRRDDQPAPGDASPGPAASS